MEYVKDRSLIRLKSPISLNLEVTGNCNWNCEFCSAANKLNEGSKHYQPFERFKHIINKSSEADVFRLNLFGGEPFLHPDIMKIAKYAKDLGFFVGFVSNGSCIDEKKASELVNYVDGGSISIHGFKDTHEKITGVKNSFDKSISTLNTLLKVGIESNICYTLTNRNLNELHDFGDYVLSNFDVGYFGVNRFIPQGRGLQNRNKLELTIPDFNKSLTILNEMKKKHKKEVRITDGFPLCLIKKEELEPIIKRCTAGISFGAIDEYGNIRFCSSSPYIIGNIFESSIEEIWQDSPILESYRSLEWIGDECKECKKFDRCLTGCRATQDKVYSQDIYLKEAVRYEKS